MSTHKYKVGDLVKVVDWKDARENGVPTYKIQHKELYAVHKVVEADNSTFCLRLLQTDDIMARWWFCASSLQLVRAATDKVVPASRQPRKKRKPVNHTLTPIKGAAGRRASEMIYYAKLGYTYTVEEIWKYELRSISKEAVRRAIRRQADCGVRELIKVAEQNYRIINGVKG